MNTQASLFPRKSANYFGKEQIIGQLFIVLQTKKDRLHHSSFGFTFFLYP
jgi:Holliday junction resolvasome RuvABC ATP-dependent DNA helicase subunit